MKDPAPEMPADSAEEAMKQQDILSLRNDDIPSSAGASEDAFNSDSESGNIAPSDEDRGDS